MIAAVQALQRALATAAGTDRRRNGRVGPRGPAKHQQPPTLPLTQSEAVPEVQPVPQRQRKRQPRSSIRSTVLRRPDVYRQHMTATRRWPVNRRRSSRKVRASMRPAESASTWRVGQPAPARTAAERAQQLLQGPGYTCSRREAVLSWWPALWPVPDADPLPVPAALPAQAAGATGAWRVHRVCAAWSPCVGPDPSSMPNRHQGTHVELCGPFTQLAGSPPVPRPSENTLWHSHRLPQLAGRGAQSLGSARSRQTQLHGIGSTEPGAHPGSPSALEPGKRDRAPCLWNGSAR